MPEVRIIPYGLKPVYSSDAKIYPDGQRDKTATKKPNGLKVGEIIQGRIIEKFDDSSVSAVFPFGSAKAFLSGKLEAGDALFFRVDAIEPYLQLKIYSVAVVQNGKAIATQEIIRILDLPDTDEVIFLIEFLKNRISTIGKDQINQFISAKRRLLSGELKGMNDEEILHLLAELEIIGLERSYRNFIKAEKLFGLKSLIPQALNYIANSDEPEAREANAEINKYGKNDFEFSIKSFSISGNSLKSRLAILMGEIIKKTSSDMKLNRSARIIYDAIDSMNFINAISVNQSNPIFLFAPIYNMDRFSVLQISSLFSPTAIYQIEKASVLLKSPSAFSRAPIDREINIIALDKIDEQFGRSSIKEIIRAFNSIQKYLSFKSDDSKEITSSQSGFSIVV